MPSPYAPSTAAPNLGYGNRAEASINTVNQWMRSQPWYQSLIKSFGQDPNNVHLNDSQKQQVIKAAQANGVVVDEGHDGQEVDDSGNFHATSHALRNTLIVAGIAGAALLTAGLAAPAAASVAGVEGGAYGVGSGTVAALGTGAMSAVPVAAATTAAGAGALGAGAAFDAAGNFIGPSTVSSVAPAVGAAGTPMLDNILKYGVPTAGNLIGGVIQAKAAGEASDAQQRYLEEALAYQKEQDAYNRKTAAELYDYSKTTEASRYGDYSKNIGPYLATGSSANARMAALLGLPANAPLTASAPPSTIGGRAASVSATTGGAPAPGVTEPGRQYERATTAPAESMVTMQAPNGSQQQVPASQVDHYKQLGATVIGQAA